MAVAIATSIALMAVFGGHGAAAGEAPKIVRTVPAPGAVVAPGALKVLVTFDRPMGHGYSFVRKDAPYPDCGANVPDRLADGRTFTLSCTVEPGLEYEMWFNSEPYMNFKGADGSPATPFQLKFRTRSR